MYMYRNFNVVVGRPFRVALLRVQTVARPKPCPTYKKTAEGEVYPKGARPQNLWVSIGSGKLPSV
ncbi:MAG: hypothetical protein HW390_3468 [Candidatus Brocadiaceae bacterium]|nr:hypothetical protein [Candidatus Brocadiaceae bacterium]